MQVKKFEAPTIQEALKVIKQEMGPDAIILSTKENRKGFGLMKKGSVEVTAAVSNRDLQKKKMTEKFLPEDVKKKIWTTPAATQKGIYNDYFEKQLKQSGPEKIEISNQAKANNRPRKTSETRYIDIKDDVAPAPKKSIRQKFDKIPENLLATKQKEPQAEVKVLEQEIDDLKQMIKQLAMQKNVIQKNESEPAELGDELTEAYQHLVNAGIEKKYARELLKSVEFDLSALEKKNSAVIQEKIALAMIDKIKVDDPLQNITALAGPGTAKIVAVIGPTGVGKTTTVAKIASQAFLEHKLRVGLINLDSYKVAAADQLMTYAKLIHCPFRSVSNKSELQQAVYDFGSLDLILIDTTGRSQKDQASLSEMKSILSIIKDLQILLTVSATTRDSDISDIVSRFKVFNPGGLIFSKLDETSVFGSIFNIQAKTGIPLNYFTVGQRVPEDIERASPERLVDLILEL